MDPQDTGYSSCNEIVVLFRKMVTAITVDPTEYTLKLMGISKTVFREGDEDALTVWMMTWMVPSTVMM